MKQSERMEIDGVFDCPPEKTTFYKAIVAFRRATGILDGVAVRAEKAIPAGGGLGGGSSDAASLLVALDALFGSELGLEGLCRLAAEVGSDVPFFIHGGAALVQGRGELIEAFPSREDFALLLAFPGFGVSTPEAYRLLDELRPGEGPEADPGSDLLKAAYRLAPAEWPYLNSFEGPVGAQRPAIQEWLRRFKEAGAPFARMSGSGSTVFGVFPDVEAARAASRVLEAAYPRETAPLLALPLAPAICLL